MLFELVIRCLSTFAPILHSFFILLIQCQNRILASKTSSAPHLYTILKFSYL